MQSFRYKKNTSLKKAHSVEDLFLTKVLGKKIENSSNMNEIYEKKLQRIWKI